MAEKPAASTMPPPSETRTKEQPSPNFDAMRSLVRALAAQAHAFGEFGERTELLDGLERSAVEWIGALESKLRALDTTSGERPMRRAEKDVLGPDFNPMPAYDRLEKEGVGTWLALIAAPSAADEPIAGGIDQVADDLCVLLLAIDGRGYSAITDSLIVSTLHALETRARVLSALARRTLSSAALAGRAA